MSKLNKAGAAKKARNARIDGRGDYDKMGRSTKPYDLGYQAYFNGMTASECSRRPRLFQLGWNHALKSDIKFGEQLTKPHLIDKVHDRIDRVAA